MSKVFSFCNVVALLWAGLAMLAAVGQMPLSAAPIDQEFRAPELPEALPAEAPLPPATAPADGRAVTPPNALAPAQEAFHAGDIDRCLALLRQAAAEQSGLSSPKMILAGFYLAEGKHAHARAVLEQCATDDPHDPQLYLMLGRLALAEGRVTDADVHFDKGLTLDAPENWTPARTQQHRSACLAGRLAVAEHRAHWSQAGSLLQRLVQLQPDNAQLRDRWARALFNAGRAEKAFEQFDVAFRQDNSINPPEVSMGVRNIRAGDYQQANAWYEKALAKYPDNPKIAFEYSVALMYQDQAELARQHAERAAALGAGSAALTLHRSQIARQLGDLTQAEELLEAGLEESPDHAAIRNLLALVLAESPDEAKRQRAIELAAAGVDENPDSPRAAATLGWIQYQQGNRDEGGQLLRTAAAKDSHPQTLYFAARVCAEQGHREEAADFARRLQQQLAQPSVFPLRPAARDWLRKFHAEK